MTRFDKAVNKAFAKFSDILIDGTYRSADDERYSAGGDNCRSWRAYPVKVIMDKPKKERNTDSGGNYIEIEALIPANTLPVQPNIGDQLILNDLLYQVIGINTDPAKALWTITVKR